MGKIKPRILNAGTAYVCAYGIIVIYEGRQYAIPFDIIKSAKYRRRWFIGPSYIYLDTENGEFELVSTVPFRVSVQMDRIKYYLNVHRERQSQGQPNGNMDDSTG